MKKGIGITLILALVGVIFFTNLFISKNFITAPLNFAKKALKYNLYEENLSLKRENEDLKAQLQKNKIFLSDNFNEPIVAGASALKARIFSQYPFNLKNIISIDKGSENDVRVKMAAVLAENILIGQVVEVSNLSSVVRTVFDPSWQLPVKIGEERINGLFKGGNDPKITLIEKPVKVGDPVFTASRDLPLDLKIGEIKEIREENKGALSEAIVKIGYNLGDLSFVFIR